MLALASTLSLAAVASASELSLNEIAAQVNAAKSTWTAHADGRFANKSHAGAPSPCCSPSLHRGPPPRLEVSGGTRTSIIADRNHKY